MKTFEFSATYHYEDTGTVYADSYEDAVAQIENDMAYVCLSAGFSDSWSWVKIDECYEIEDDGDKEWDD